MTDDQWCTFGAGSLWCVNDPCPNPRHRIPVETPEVELEPVPMRPLPCLRCGVMGRSGVTGLCAECREAT